MAKAMLDAMVRQCDALRLATLARARRAMCHLCGNLGRVGVVSWTPERIWTPMCLGSYYHDTEIRSFSPRHAHMSFAQTALFLPGLKEE